MRPFTFKFLNYPIVKSHEGIDIFAGEEFYTVNKEDIHTARKTTKKYTIVARCVSEEAKHKFKPDTELLWYFKSKSAAEWYVAIWKAQDSGMIS